MKTGILKNPNQLIHSMKAGDYCTDCSDANPPEAHLRVPREYFGVLYLDNRHRVVGSEIISVGSLSASLVHPREVFRGAVVSRAAALVLFHNHPSGDPEPSAEDLALTRRLAAAGSLMGIEVLDHVIVGEGELYVSLKDRGVL